MVIGVTPRLDCGDLWDRGRRYVALRTWLPTYKIQYHFLSQCRSLSQRDIMRCFGVHIKQDKVGFAADAMACWLAVPGIVESAGRKLAMFREVSHCYKRITNPSWCYNLFAMIHGHAREDCQVIADKISREIGLKDYVLLFSVKEFKKLRVRYSI